MKSHGFDQLPVVLGSKIKGLITLGNILSKLTSGKIGKDTAVDKVMFKFDNSKHYVNMEESTKLPELIKFFDKHSAAIITDKDEIRGIVTKIDVIDWMLKK
eukprot:NODE_227_length_12294_cov_1.542681.p12 type:complete len:101 gc:universal NODE_227_length_12294_cov_1.542681:4269-3967(-)